MKRFIIGVVCLILVAGFGASARAAQSLIPGDWVGGYEINRNYTPIRTGFSLEGAGIKGTLNLPVRGVTSVALDQVRFLSPNLHFELPRSAGPLIFDGRLSGDFITGNIQSGSERGTFHLVRAVTLDAKVFDQYLGDYQIGRDSYVSIGRTPDDEPTDWNHVPRTRSIQSKASLRSALCDVGNRIRGRARAVGTVSGRDKRRLR